MFSQSVIHGGSISDTPISTDTPNYTPNVTKVREFVDESILGNAWKSQPTSMAIGILTALNVRATKSFIYH
jgi:hypothetical protein